MSIRPAIAWPWSSGITPTCPGTPRRSSCCRSCAVPVRRPVRMRSRRPARRGGWRAAPRSPLASQPGAATGSLRFVSDHRGWWQPTLHPGLPGGPVEATPLSIAAAEFHGPDWVLGQATMAELVDGTVVARMTASGRVRCARPAGPGRAGGRPPRTGAAAVRVDRRGRRHGEGLALIGSTADSPPNVWVGTPDGPPAARAPAPRDRPRTGRCGDGRTLHADRPLRPPSLRHAVPAGPRRNQGVGCRSATAGDVVSWRPDVFVPGRDSI